MNAAEEIDRIKNAKTYYDVLNVPIDCDNESIKQKYKKLALLLHPDKCSSEGCEDAFKSVSSAYSCLSSDNRSKYDRNHNFEDEGYADDNEDDHRARHMFRSREVFEKFMRSFFDNEGSYEADFDDEFDYWREYFQIPNLPHRRAKADWGSANMASNEKANCFHCKKHLPAIDVRYSALPFYYDEKLCSNCFKQFELLNTEVIDKLQGIEAKNNSQKTLVFSFRTGNSKTKDRMKSVLRRDKGWSFEEHPGAVLWAINTVEGCQCPIDEEYYSLPHAVAPVAATAAKGTTGSKKKKR